MPSYTYCPSCGSKIEYALSKPDKCPRCGKAFAAAYSKPSVASVPVVASAPTPVATSNDASLLASLPPEMQALVVQALAQKLAGGAPARQAPSRTVQPQRGTAAMRKQMAIRRAAASNNTANDEADLTDEGSDDDGDYSAEDEYYNEAEAHMLADQMRQQIDISQIVVSVPTSNPNIQRFGDICNGQRS